MALLISIVATILFMTKWGIERTRTKALMYFIVDRGYTPPTKQEMMYARSSWKRLQSLLAYRIKGIL